MPIISRLVGSRRLSRKRNNTGLIESLERRTLLSAGGILDPTFGPGGFVKGYQVEAVQPDGSLVAQQVDNQENKGALVVLSPNGVLEGPYTGTLPSPGPVPAYETYSDGRYIKYSIPPHGVTRYKADGTVDTSFGNNGTVSDFSTGTAYPPGTFTPQGFQVINDRVYVDGILSFTSLDSGTDYDFAFERLNDNGTIDTSFGTQGIADAKLNLTPEVPNATGGALGPNGDLYETGDDGQGDPIIMQFSAAGQLLHVAYPHSEPPDYLGGLPMFNGDAIYFLTESKNIDSLQAFDLNLNQIPDFGNGGPDFNLIQPPPFPATPTDAIHQSSPIFDGSGRMFVSEFFDYTYGQTQFNGEYTLAYLPGSASAGSISGHVYLDANGNGVMDSGESGTYQSGAATFKPQTTRIFADLNGNGQYDLGEPVSDVNSDGTYEIQSLQPGTYHIREMPMDGAVVSTSPVLTITVTANQDSLNNDFGNQFAVRITGTVFNDLNGDGILEAGEAGLAEQQVYIDTFDAGKFLAGENSVTTDANGNYAFVGLVAGTYRIREVVPAGSSVTRPGVAPGGDVYYDVAVPSGTSAVNNIDFGQYSGSTPTPVAVSSSAGEISGTVFNDVNHDGKQDGREKPLAGVQLYIDLNGNGQLDAGEPTATTDAQGQYAIFVPQGGAYQVLPVPSTGLIETNAANGHLLVQAGAEANVTSPDIGLAPGAVVSGLVVNDTKGKGHANKKSPPLSGWRVFVDLNGDGIWQSDEPSALTDANGRYTISRLAAGKVIVRTVPQDGWQQTQPRHSAPIKVHLKAKKTTGLHLFEEHQLV